MRGIQIHDRDDRGLLTFDLLEILTAVGIEAEGCLWTCQNVECTGHAAAELEALDDKGARFNGDELRRLAGGITQTIDGEFIGTAEVNDTVVLVIRAIDSTRETPPASPTARRFIATAIVLD